MENGMFFRTATLEKALDGSWLRNQIIANNIANEDTPMYKRKDVAFADELKQALDVQGIKGIKTREKHMDIGHMDIQHSAPKIKNTYGTKMRMDGNNVDIDVEMSELAKNTIYYDALRLKASKEFQRLKMVISEGRR
ncbi:MAG: flagellar basal body rod protein FlgB [Xylanivirga thermophila]|jgi:flagellar basal-body rod protein FlgB|uniref:flagellar basal body rod protein FlgB n=1 Tax=Xylanivirga thermophila TaxID=2496273 RepID=UPI00101B9F69|nr:flagellar basal body rod protein FlgB [Xylanivirga thermophila]